MTPHECNRVALAVVRRAVDEQPRLELSHLLVAEVEEIMDSIAGMAGAMITVVAEQLGISTDEYFERMTQLMEENPEPPRNKG